MEMGATIRRLARSAGLSQAELSRRTGIPARTLRAIMRGEVSVKLCQVCAIARALGMTCAELVARAETVVRSTDPFG